MHNTYTPLSTFIQKIKFIVGLQAQHWHVLAAYLLIIVAINMLSAIIPYFTKLQIDQLEQQSNQFLSLSSDPLLIFSLLLLIPAAIEIMRLLFFERLEQVLSTTINTTLRIVTERKVWEKIRQLDAGFFMSQRNTRILAEGLAATNVVISAFNFLVKRVAIFTGLLTILPILAYLSIPLLVLVLCFTLIQLVITYIVDQYKRAYSLLERNQNDAVWIVRQQLEKNFYDLLTLGATDSFIAQQNELLKTTDKLYFEREETNRKLQTVNFSLETALHIAISVFVAYQVFRGNLSIGTFTVIVSYTRQIASYFQSLMGAISDWKYIDIDLEAINFVLSLQSRLKSTKKPIPIPRDRSKMHLTAQEVTFAYPDAYAEERKFLQIMLNKINSHFVKKDAYYIREMKKWQDLLSESDSHGNILHNVSLHVEQGKIVALVGRNGSGKTTIAHVLQHHFEAQSGTVELAQEPLYKYEQQQLLQQFSWLKQNPFVLERYSIKDNLLLGVTDIQQALESIPQLLDKLGLSSVISSNPKGIDAVIGEDIILSGGQNQLIAFTRALLQKRPFMIFDEGSSQLDIEKEFSVLQLLHQYKADSAILFITHRMSVARKADYIYVIDNGHVVEEGTHAQLLDNQKLYAQFWSMQTIE